MGVIIRTAGQKKEERFFVRDLHLLLQQWNEIETKLKSQESPAFLYQEPDLIGLTVNFLTDDVDRVQVDKKDDFDRLMEGIKKIDAKSNTEKITHFDEEIPILKDLMSRDR